MARLENIELLKVSREEDGLLMVALAARLFQVSILFVKCILLMKGLMPLSGGVLLIATRMQHGATHLQTIQKKKKKKISDTSFMELVQHNKHGVAHFCIIFFSWIWFPQTKHSSNLKTSLY